jgi:TolA-binding protein
MVKMITISDKRYPPALFITLILFFMLIASGGNTGAATSAENALRNADSSRESLYQSNKRMSYRHNWETCIAAYEKIYTDYPKTDQAAWALFHSAGMYVRLNRISTLEKDLNEALKLYERIVKEYPEHSLADDAQYKMGEIYYAIKKDNTQAYVEFLKVEIKFPNGDMRPAAKSMLEKLSAILGEKQEKERQKMIHQPAQKRRVATVRNIRYWSTPTIQGGN